MIIGNKIDMRDDNNDKHIREEAVLNYYFIFKGKSTSFITKLHISRMFSSDPRRP